jgi:DNA-binding NarL/FixJ family response regulator
MVKLLIVEDNNDLRETIKQVLISRLPLMTVFEARDAEEAEAIINGQELDAILTDLKLPGNGGLWLTERTKLKQPQLPIIINSCLDSAEYRVAAFQLGADYFLSKKENSLNDVVRIIKSISTA